MKKKKKNKELVRNLVRISLILLLSLLVTVILCRKEAKANKNYELADKIRDELLNMGIKLIDTKDGTSFEKI